LLAKGVEFTRLVLRCLILATVSTLVLEGVIFLRGSEVAWLFLYPALRGTDFVVGSQIATSESGLENLLRLLLASSVLNVLLYTLVFLGLFKIVSWICSGWVSSKPEHQGP
jgi:hypothetical protein